MTLPQSPTPLQEVMRRLQMTTLVLPQCTQVHYEVTTGIKLEAAEGAEVKSA